MSRTYGLLSEDGQSIIREITLDVRKMHSIGGKQSARHSDEWMRENGWIPYIAPARSICEAVGPIIVGPSSYTREVGRLPREQILDIREEQVKGVRSMKVSAMCSPDQQLRAVARGAHLNRRAVKNTLTAAEETEAQYLEAMAEADNALWQAQEDIITAIEAMTDQQLADLPEGWAETRQEWPA